MSPTLSIPRLLLPWLPVFSLFGADPKASYREWQIYHGDYGGTHYAELDQINRSNVKRLQLAWTWKSGDVGNTIECNPIIVNGVMFVTTPQLHVAALDAATGEVRWRFDPWEGARGNGVNRGVAHWTDGRGDERIFHSAGDWLYALDAKTGKPVPGFGRDGRISHRDGFDPDIFSLRVGNNTPGIVWRDLLILGSTTGEGPQPTAPGHIRAFDVRTGERKWIFHTIPHPGEFGGSATPSTFEVDGRQYVVIAAGGGGKPGSKAGDRYYCFALPREAGARPIDCMDPAAAQPRHSFESPRSSSRSSFWCTLESSYCVFTAIW